MPPGSCSCLGGAQGAREPLAVSVASTVCACVGPRAGPGASAVPHPAGFGCPRPSRAVPRLEKHVAWCRTSCTRQTGKTAGLLFPPKLAGIHPTHSSRRRVLPSAKPHFPLGIFHLQVLVHAAPHSILLCPARSFLCLKGFFSFLNTHWERKEHWA